MVKRKSLFLERNMTENGLLGEGPTTVHISNMYAYHLFGTEEFLLLIK